MSTENEAGAAEPAVDTSLAPQTQGETASEMDEEIGEDLAAPEGEQGAEGERPERTKLTARQRVEQAVARQREAERDAEYWKAKATQPVPSPTAREPQPVQAAESDEPDPEDYEHGINDLAYIKDVARFEARQEFRREAEQDRAQQSARSRLASFEAKSAELYPDGDPSGLVAFKDRAGQLHIATQEVIAESDVGPKVADYLGSNPRELQRISALPPAQQVRQVTLIEARLSASAAPVAKTATDAPEPPPRTRGAGGQFKVAPDTGDFAAFEKQYGV